MQMYITIYKPLYNLGNFMGQLLYFIHKSSGWLQQSYILLQLTLMHIIRKLRNYI